MVEVSQAPEGLPEVRIRELVAGAGEQLAELFAAMLPDSPTALVDELSEPEVFFRESSTFALGAYVDDAAVGLAWGLQMRSLSGRLTTYLHELEVHEDWRRQGVGSALVSKAMTIARRNGSTKFWLSTGGHNEMAQALDRSLGGDRKPLGDLHNWWDLDRAPRLPTLARRPLRATLSSNAGRTVNLLGNRQLDRYVGDPL